MLDSMENQQFVFLLSAERMAGWEYAVGIFIGLNFVAFVYILVAYVVMFITVKNTS